MKNHLNKTELTLVVFQNKNEGKKEKRKRNKQKRMK